MRVSLKIMMNSSVMRRFALAALGVLLPGLSAGGTSPVFDPDAIFRHISVLAHDSLEGRRVGDPGARKAAAYIQSQFEHIGLEPGGGDGRGGRGGAFRQEFEFTAETHAGAMNTLVIGDRKLRFIQKSES